VPHASIPSASTRMTQPDRAAARDRSDSCVSTASVVPVNMNSFRFSGGVPWILGNAVSCSESMKPATEALLTVFVFKGSDGMTRSQALILFLEPPILPLRETKQCRIWGKFCPACRTLPNQVDYVQINKWRSACHAQWLKPSAIAYSCVFGSRQGERGLRHDQLEVRQVK
jgi:hypothetical protein